jgi:hypothetical protein
LVTLLSEDDAPEPGRKFVRRSCETLLEVLNGDWKVNRLQTHARPPAGPDCDVREETCKIVYAALSLSFLFGGLNTAVAKSRWGTCAKVLAAQVLGQFLHSVLPRVLARAFPTWRSMADLLDHEEAGNDDFHKRVKSKISRSLRWTQDAGLQSFAAVASVVSEPLDHLLQA